MVNESTDHKILNVFELFMVEVIQELFKQIRKESSLELSLTFTTGKSKVKRKSLSNTMIRAYNWLLDFDLIPENLGDLTKNQIKMYTSRERPKSAPYLRLKNSKRTSKCQVFSSTVPA